MYPLQKNDSLSRTTFYELYRDHHPLQIRICYNLSGHNAGKYMAHSYASEITIAHQWAIADSEQSAIRETLSKIQELTYKEIIYSC